MKTCPNVRLIRGNSVPCGSCPVCLSRVRWQKSARILSECSNSKRTWWCRFSLRKDVKPEAEVYAEVQLFLKRLRKRGFALRYAFVAERGTQGTQRLHYHALLHGDEMLTKRAIQSEWKLGQTNVKLLPHVSDGAAAARVARYVAKYATKASRFRFSQGYGSRPWKGIEADETVAAVLAAFPGASIARVRVAGVGVPRKLLGLEGASPCLPPVPPLVRADHLDWLYRRGEWGDALGGRAEQLEMFRHTAFGWKVLCTSEGSVEPDMLDASSDVFDVEDAEASLTI